MLANGNVVEDVDVTVLVKLVSGAATITIVVGDEMANVVDVALGTGPTLEAVMTRGGTKGKGITI